MPVEKNTVFIWINRSVDAQRVPVNSSSPISHANATDAVVCVCVCVEDIFITVTDMQARPPVQDLPNNSLCWLRFEA